MGMDITLTKTKSKRLAFEGDPWGWTLRAKNERYWILTRNARFKPKGNLLYTIIDWERDLRGPCDLVGQGWGDGTYSDDECANLLSALEEGRVGVSYRNNVPIKIRGYNFDMHSEPVAMRNVT